MKKLFWFTVGFTLVFSLVFATYAGAADGREGNLEAARAYFMNECNYAIAMSVMIQLKLDKHYQAWHFNKFHNITHKEVMGCILTSEERSKLKDGWDKRAVEMRKSAIEAERQWSLEFGPKADTRTPDEYNSSPRRFE
jgi:hypothetical protein